MDAYPPEYVQHNVPFVVLSGLGAKAELDPSQPVQDVLPGRAATNVTSDAPLVADERAHQLLEEFLSYDATNVQSNGNAGNLTGFRIRAVGRVGQAARVAYVGVRRRDMLMLSVTRTSSFPQRKRILRRIQRLRRLAVPR